MNALQHRAQSTEYLRVRETENEQAKRSQLAVSSAICIEGRGFGMLITVNFDHEARVMTVEVDDVATDRLLTTEPQPA